MNIYWCPQCDDGYHADHEGCPKCGDETAPAPKSKPDDATLAGCVMAVAAVALVLGFVLGFFVRGCV